MLLLLRAFKRKLFANDKLRSYLIYALGEMVLVVIGILIALKIDNWNTRNTREAALQSYLGSIAENMRGDLKSVAALREHRNAVIENTARRRLISIAHPLGKEEIGFASNTLFKGSKIDFFVASDSAFDALKSSGHLDLIRGTELERLLYDYYDTANRIKQEEASYNDDLRALYTRVLNDWPDGIPIWEYRSPNVINPERLVELQPKLKALQRDSGIETLLLRASSSQSLLLDYERLDALGKAFINLVENGAMNLNTALRTPIEALSPSGRQFGFSQIVRDGQLSFYSYSAIFADSSIRGIMGYRPEDAQQIDALEPYDQNSFRRSEGSLNLSFNGGAHWAAISFIAFDRAANRHAIDLSQYDTLRIEAKGQNDNPKVYVNMKDVDDPDDGSQTNIELPLTEEWETIEIPLTDFKNADLTRIHVALAFLFLDGAASLEVRNVSFGKSL